MPSREARRRIERKQDKPIEQEKRIEKHPVLYVVSLIILVVVVISFIFTGSMSRASMGMRDELSFGRYENRNIELLPGSKVPLNYFTSKLQSYANETEGQENQARYIYREAFNETTFHYTMLDLAKQSNYSVSKDRVIDALQTISIYLDKNGDFSEKKYNETSILERTMLNNLLTEQMIHKDLIDDLLFSHTLSSKEVQFYKDMASKERRYSFVSFKFDNYPEAKVREYAKTNTEKFRKIKLSRILLVDKSQREAEQIQNMFIQKEKSFEDLATIYSKDVFAEKSGDMGWQFYYQLKVFIESDDTVRDIFKLKKDDITMIKNGDNWEIYRCNEPVLEPDIEDATVRKGILDYMMKFEKGSIEDYAMGLAKEFKDKTAAKDFDAVCKEFKLFPPYETEFFPINYQGIFAEKEVKVKGDGPSIGSATMNKEFFQEAFSVSKEVVSKPISLGDQVVILKLLEEKTLTDTDWTAANETFKIGIQMAQYNPTMQKYVMALNKIGKENNIPLYGVYMELVDKADKLNAPYEYIMNTTMFHYRDLDEMIGKLKTKKLVDTFDATFAKMTTAK